MKNALIRQSIEPFCFGDIYEYNFTFSVKYLASALKHIDRKAECETYICVHPFVKQTFKSRKLNFYDVVHFFHWRNRLHVEFRWSAKDNLQKFNQPREEWVGGEQPTVQLLGAR